MALAGVHAINLFLCRQITDKGIVSLAGVHTIYPKPNEVCPTLCEMAQVQLPSSIHHKAKEVKKQNIFVAT